MNTFENKPHIIGLNDKVLVTGSGGFVGQHVVNLLSEYGFKDIRALVRSTSGIHRLKFLQYTGEKPTIEVLQANLGSRRDCERAVEGVKVIYHLAAGADGKSYAGSFYKSVITTRNLIEAALQRNTLVRFVNIGSFASYSNRQMKRNALLDESCPIVSTNWPEINPYTFAKTEQDYLVIKYGRDENLPWVIMRLGAVYGPGVKEWITSRVGIDTFGFFLHLGGRNILPLTYVENCAESIILAGLKSGVEHHIFNIIDDDLPKSKDFLKLHKKNVKPFFSLNMPYRLFHFFSYLWESYSRFSNGQIPLAFNRHRADSMWKGNTYSNEMAKRLLGWKPRYSYKEATEKYFEFLRKRMVEEKAC